ncbi:hypothetical protein B0H14DRAFT_3696973, partial [Mycena olivaceomarginata]
PARYCSYLAETPRCGDVLSILFPGSYAVSWDRISTTLLRELCLNPGRLTTPQLAAVGISPHRSYQVFRLRPLPAAFVGVWQGATTIPPPTTAPLAAPASGFLPSGTYNVPHSNPIRPAGSAFDSESVASSGFSATARTLFGSRPEAGASTSQRGRSPLPGSTAAPHFFRNFADTRKRATQAAMHTSAPFHPALKSQLEADLNRPGSRKRKKREDASPSRERNAKPKGVKQLNCVFVAVPFTKDINRGRCSVPAAHLLVRLDEAGFDDTGADIRTKVLINFSDIEAFTGHGFRLLVSQRPMRLNRHGNLVPSPVFHASSALLSASLITLQSKCKFLLTISLPSNTDILICRSALTDSNVRLSGPRFKKIVFIAVNPAGPNLPLRGFSYDRGDDLDHDLASDYLSESSESSGAAEDSDMDTTMDGTKSGDEELPAPDFSKADNEAKGKGKGKAKESEHDRKGKKKASTEGSRFDTGFFDDDVAAGVAYESDKGPRSPDEVPEPKAHLTVVRLLHNMHKPDSKPSGPAGLWVEQGIGCFLLGTKSTEICAGILIQFLASPDQSVLSPSQVLAFIDSNICQPFAMLTKLGGRLLGATERLGTPEFEADFDGNFAIGPGGLHGLAPHILPAYLSLPVSLKAGASPAAVSAVKVATEGDFRLLNLNLLIATLDKESPNVDEIVFLLMDALGDASNPREMAAERVLKGGEFGMLRFYTLVVARVLDSLDTAHPDYTSLLSSIQNASAGIARKIRNYFKSGGTNATSGPSSSGPNTRSRSQRTTGKSDNNVDEDMTNTDSLESGWEHDCSSWEEPDISARRAKRRPHPPKPEPKKPPPIVRWRVEKTYAKWKKQTHLNPPHQPSGNTPSTATSQTRTKPAWLDPDALEDDDVEDAIGLLRRTNTRYWQGVIQEIVERFPHPEEDRRLTMNVLLAPGMTRARQYHMLSLAYHVDRNVSGSAHWRKVTGILSQILNDTRSSKLDDPRIVPRESRF